MANEATKRSWTIRILALVMILGLIGTYSSLFTGATNATQTNLGQTISYNGVDSTDSLTLLKKTHSVKTQTNNNKIIVTSIDDQTPDNSQVWNLYKNDQLQTESPDKIMTTVNDTLTWKIESK